MIEIDKIEIYQSEAGTDSSVRKTGFTKQQY